MNAENPTAVPAWFRITGILALIWNLLGVSAYIMQVRMTEADIAALPEAQQMLYANTPAWATGAFAVAVFGGAVGCLLLVMRKGLALPVLIVSLLAVLVQMFHAFFMSESFEVFGPGAMVMPVMVMVIAIGLVFLAKRARASGWLI